jgi:virginiamycin B lyase
VTASPFSFHEVARASDGVRALAVTADSAAWCVLEAAGAVVRCAPDGTLSRFDLGSGAAGPHSVAPATRDSVWVTDRAANRILRLDGSGVGWSVTAPTPDAGLGAVVGLDDGSAWFIEERSDALGRIDILGRVTEFDTGATGGEPSSIASDGTSVWFGLPGAGAVAFARGGDSQPRLLTFDDPLAAPVDLSVGDDGWLWFADRDRHLIGRLDRSGHVTEFVLPTDLSRPTRVAADGSGGCWFTTDGAARIGRVDRDGLFTSTSIPGARGLPIAVAVAPSLDVWVALHSGVLVQIHDPGSLAADIQ